METDPTNDGTPVSDIEAARAKRAAEQVEPNLKAPKAEKATAKAAKAPAAKKVPAAKKAAKKAPAAKKAASTSGVKRSPSTVSKEGTQKDAFTGESLPVTAFPTSRDKEGNVVRGAVARKNLEAFRASKKAEREAAKAAAATAKAAKAKEAKK